MRGKIKLVSFVLCAVFMLSFGMTAHAQVDWNVSTNINEVVHYGVTELMGRVQLEVRADATTQGSTITVTYQGVQIKNPSAAVTNIETQAAGGVLVNGNGTTAFASCAITYTSVASTGTGGQVIISVPGACALTAGDKITVDGVRADISTKNVTDEVQASLSSSPSTANTFTSFSTPRVATVNESLIVTAAGATDAICILPPGIPTLTLKEGFAGGFVQYVASTGSGAAPIPLNFRDPFGAINNTQINLSLSPLPTGVTLTWPDTVASDIVGGGVLAKISQSTSGDAALYDFTTPDQFISDGAQETFVFDTTNLIVDVDQDTALQGTSTIQAQLYPGVTATTAIPRFAHPLINSPADLLLTISKCTTNILFPFVTNQAASGFDSGFAIANTSSDPYGTIPQEGTITAYFYGTDAPAPLTTASIPAGSEYTGVLSQIAPGFQGYIIAICQFQYGHAYAFITGKYNAGSVFDVAEGYIANIIPDPAFTDGVRRPGPASPLFAAGEVLGQ